MFEAADRLLGVGLEDSEGFLEGVKPQCSKFEVFRFSSDSVGLDGVELELQAIELEVFDLHLEIGSDGIIFM